ncbi:hypothetical protein ACHAXR_011312 [Thalassiosira sp. AJA248-18]
MAKKRSHSPEDDDEIVDENRPNGSSYDEEEEEEVEEDHDDGDNRRRKKKKKKKKFGIMSASNQTEAERRVLRRRQRELQSDIAMGASSGGAAAGGADGGGADDPTSGELQRLRDQNNELWNNVHYTREAVLDSENVDLLASKAARQAEKIVQVPRYDAIRLAQSLVKKGTIRTGSSSQFSWRGLGFQVGVCFNALPSHVSFLYGPLDAEYTPKERKKPERRKKQAELAESENEEEEQPEDVDQAGKKKESDGNELSAVEKHISVIRHTISDRTREEQKAAMERANEYETQLSQEIDDDRVVQKKKKKFVAENAQLNAAECLFNPKSFTQTVENIFHFSFSVKQGQAGIKTRSLEEAKEFGCMPGPVVRPTSSSEPKTPKQAIVSLNMKVREKAPHTNIIQAIIKLDMKMNCIAPLTSFIDWKDMCNAYNVEASDVPHRVDGKVAKKEKKARKSH